MKGGGGVYIIIKKRQSDAVNARLIAVGLGPVAVREVLLCYVGDKKRTMAGCMSDACSNPGKESWQERSSAEDRTTELGPADSTDAR